MSTEANKAVLRKWFGETVGKADISTVIQMLDSVFSPNFIDHDGPDPQNGREALKRALSVLLTGVDLEFTIEKLIGEYDLVAIRLRGEAVHVREIMGHPPTGKTISWTENEIFRFENGQIVESWGEGTLEEALAQTGLSFKGR